MLTSAFRPVAVPIGAKMPPADDRQTGKIAAHALLALALFLHSPESPDGGEECHTINRTSKRCWPRFWCVLRMSLSFLNTTAKHASSSFGTLPTKTG